MMGASFFRHRSPLLLLAAALMALAVLFVHDTPPPAQAQQAVTPGSLDASFGTGGKVTTDIGSGNTQAFAVALQSDGKIVAAGWAIGSGADFALARYNADGTLDDTFGEVVSGSTRSGKAVTSFTSGNDQAFAVAVQSDGKIVVAGYATSSGTGKDFALARYNANGTLDTGFGTGGKVTTDIGSNSSDEALAVAVQPDGKIVAAGGNAGDFALARYNTDGSLDDTFGTVVSGNTRSGKQTTDFASGHDTVYGVAVQSDGKIVAAGSAGADFALARYNANGTLDTGFGTGGKVTTDLGGAADVAYAVAVQSDGKIVVAGTDAADFALARYNTAGTLDDTFGTVVSGNTRSGKVTTPIGSSTDFAYAVAVQSDGRIVAAGYSNAAATSRDIALARYTTTGELDTGFGTGGKVTTAIATGSVIDIARGVAVQSDGKIVVAGHSNNDFALARYHGQQPASSHVYVSNLSQDADGSITTAGSATAQGFATGSVTGGYTLTGIDLVIGSSPTEAQRDTIRAQLWSAVPSGTNAGSPNAKLADLTVPAHPVTAGTVTFAAPSGTTLSASTNLFVVVYTTGNFNLQIGYTNSDNEDSGGAAGWSIGDTNYAYLSNEPNGDIWSADAGGASVRIRVKGTEAQVQSSDATLSALTVEGSTDGNTFAALTGAAALAPAFDAATTGYRATVGNDVTHVKLTPTASDTGASVEVGKSGGTLSTVNSGTASNAIALDLGDNEITVRVTAPDNTTQDYTVTVRRVPAGAVWWATLVVADLNIAKGYFRSSAQGSLSDNDFTYGGVDYGIDGVRLINIDRRLQIIFNKAIPSDLKAALTLNVGSTQFALADATLTNSNTWVVWSNTGLSWSVGDTVSLFLTEGTAQSSDADLSNLTGTPCTSSTSCTGTLALSPAFDAATISYTATVANTVTHATLTPTASHASATIRAGKGGTESPVNSGSASHAIALAEGSNLLDVTVTAEDGVTIKGYFVTITREAAAEEQSSDATLSSLTAESSADGNSFDALELAPAFDLAATGYTATVANDRTHARLTPTASHSGATVQVGRAGSLAPVNSGTPSHAIALDVGANQITVRVTAEDSTTRDYTVTITRLATSVEDWTPTLNVRRLGPGNEYWVGCRNNVSGAGCNTESVLTEDEFSYTRFIYGEPFTWTFQVRELYRTSKGSSNQLVLVANVIFESSNGPEPAIRGFADHLFRDFALTVRGPGSTTQVKLPFSEANLQGNTARWTYHGTPWSINSTLQLGMERPRATLDSVYVHYDGDPPVDDFLHYAKALWSPYGLKAFLPGEYVSIDPDNEDPVQVTHAKLKVFGAHRGVSIRVGKVTYDANGNRSVAYPSSPLMSQGDTSHAIELNADNPITPVDIEVTDGGVKRTHLLHIDPPPRTYWLSPEARVAEGQDALLTLSLSQPAPAGGLEFTVTAGYGSAGSEDVGEIASPVTLPEGAVTLEIAVPTVDDDQDEADESFTVTVAAVRSGWAMAPLGNDTTTVTIEDDDATPDQGQSPQVKYAELIAKVKEWRNDPCCAHNKEHTDRWDRVLLTFGEDVADQTLEVMTADEAQTYADRGWTRWVEVAKALRELEQQETSNRAPTVANPIADATIVNESGTHQFSLSGVFDDADGDSLTVTAASSDQAVATALVASDQSSLTVTAKSQGTATITVTAQDGKGGTVDDAFTVRVKAAPVVASPIADLGLEEGTYQEISVSGTFSDGDGDSLTVTAATSDKNKAAVAVASDQSRLTVAGIAEGTATITVTARDSDGNRVSDAFDVSVTTPPPQQQDPSNRAPTVSGAIADATIVNESGTRELSLSGVFSDADNDALTITAASSGENVATVSVASGYASLTVTAKSRGTSTITVTAKDGKGGTVSDTFTVTVKAAPVVASPLADVSGLEVDATQEVSLAGVFSDADGDALTITAASSDETKATVAVAADQSKLTLTGVAAGTATITVTAQDSDGNRVSDTLDVKVVEAEAEHGDPAPALNLRCIAETDRVAFLWDAPEWSGGDLYAYDYQLTLPDGRSESGRLTGSTLLLRPGDYQQGAEASVSVKAVYETDDGSEVSSAEATLTCRVGQ